MSMDQWERVPGGGYHAIYRKGSRDRIGQITTKEHANITAVAPEMLAELHRLMDVLGDEDREIVGRLIARAEGRGEE